MTQPIYFRQLNLNCVLTDLALLQHFSYYFVKNLSKAKLNLEIEVH